jgi:phosphatidylinositol kinase/protein kinase (PI-3  family)
LTAPGLHESVRSRIASKSFGGDSFVVPGDVLTESQYNDIMKQAADKVRFEEKEARETIEAGKIQARSYSVFQATTIKTEHYEEDETLETTKGDRSLSIFYTQDAIQMPVIYNEVESTVTRPSLFKESFEIAKERIRSRSPFGHLKTWNLIQVIVKCGDDLRQEQLAMQMISLFKQIFTKNKCDLWLKDYEIIATGLDCGILECVSDACSIDSLKKSLPPNRNSLLDFFKAQFGEKTRGNCYSAFKDAKKNFVKSLAGYSLLSYILQIKDRHNGNILMDKDGHIIHIDFGFMFSNSPGGNLNFEKAPFKLTVEFEELMGGRRSKLFNEFRALCVRGFKALKKNTNKIILLVEMMRQGVGSEFPCFVGGEEVIRQLKERLRPRAKMSDNDCKEYVNWLINESLDNWTTRCYDRFQYCCQNIVY